MRAGDFPSLIRALLHVLLRFRSTLLRSKVGNQKEGQHGHEDDRGQGVHGGLDSPSHLAVDQGGQGVDACASGKVGDDKVVQGQGKAHQKA